MNPQVFTILNASASVKALFGSTPLRVFPAGEAPETAAKPYATYAVFNALPENLLGEVPRTDTMGTQIDIWASTYMSALAGAAAIRDALEPAAHMTGYELPGKDAETKLYHVRMDFDFIQDRS